jgi:C4-dicarboxylate transporter
MGFAIQLRLHRPSQKSLKKIYAVSPLFYAVLALFYAVLIFMNFHFFCQKVFQTIQVLDIGNWLTPELGSLPNCIQC